MRRFCSTILAASIAAALPAAVDAQLSTTIYGVGEFDTQDVVLVLGGVSLTPGGLGLRPTGNLQAYWLQYPTGLGDAKTDQIGVTPSVGLRYMMPTSFFEVRGGYTFVDTEAENFPAGVVANVGDGAMAAAQWEHWGTGRLGLQALGSYNFGSETLWTRGRVTHGIFNYGPQNPVHIGAEAAYLTSSSDLVDYSALQVGGLLGMRAGESLIFNVGAGRKLVDAPLEDATYFRVEMVFLR